MMKSEFEELVDEEIDQDDYKKIETVYVWYPAFGDKRMAAQLYREFGMRIFEDMYPRAKKAEDLDFEIGNAKARHEFLKKQLIEL